MGWFGGHPLYRAPEIRLSDFEKYTMVDYNDRVFLEHPSLSGLLHRPAMYDAYHHITNMTNPDGDIQVVDVTGSLCENNDKFAKNRELPEARIGDTLVIHDTGAHGFSMGYNYNGRLRSAEILYQEDGTARMIRRSETMNDYFATLDGFDFDI